MRPPIADCRLPFIGRAGWRFCFEIQKYSPHGLNTGLDSDKIFPVEALFVVFGYSKHEIVLESMNETKKILPNVRQPTSYIIALEVELRDTSSSSPVKVGERAVLLPSIFVVGAAWVRGFEVTPGGA